MYYFDTSALLKRYIDEPGTAQVLKLFARHDALMITSGLTLVEGYHGICRKCRDERVTFRKTEKLLRSLSADLRDFRIVSYDSGIVAMARKIIKKNPIRSLDAIHVASALAVRPPAKTSFLFVSCDERQAKTASACGVSTFDPMREQGA